jgi:hypothetical protein
MPVCDRVRKRARAMSARGTAIMVTMSLALKMIPPNDQLTVNGGLSRSPSPASASPLIQLGIASARTSRSCDTPIVATVRIRRGALRNRRMITSSVNIPTTIAATMPMPSPSQ